MQGSCGGLGRVTGMRPCKVQCRHVEPPRRSGLQQRPMKLRRDRAALRPFVDPVHFNVTAICADIASQCRPRRPQTDNRSNGAVLLHGTVIMDKRSIGQEGTKGRWLFCPPRAMVTP